MAIGAFLAGLIISESEYGQQALSDVLPFRALFSGVFFTSIGMLIDLPLAMSQPLVVIKSVVASGAVGLRGRGLETSLTSGLSLAQIGEFSFVLAAAGLPLGLFRGNDYQSFLTVAALSLMVAPFLLESAHTLAEAIGSRLRGTAWRDHDAAAERCGASDLAVAVGDQRDHAVVIGYGVAGRYLARMLQAASIQ